MTPNHAKFVKHLEQSESARWAVAKWLTERGHYVRIPPVSTAPEHAQWREHADGGDLEICLRIEVKQLKVQFTGPENWPYKDQFIVCAKHSFDRAKPKPYAYVILAAGGEHAAIVMSDSSKLWQVANKTDSRYESVAQDFYLCPINEVKWIRL